MEIAVNSTVRIADAFVRDSERDMRATVIALDAKAALIEFQHNGKQVRVALRALVAAPQVEKYERRSNENGKTVLLRVYTRDGEFDCAQVFAGGWRVGGNYKTLAGAERRVRRELEA